MPLPPLTIIPAGAGSGKTYTIQKTLAEWVTNGLVRPERIVAVTFTEAAAAEMRGRIRAELTAQNRLEDALRLDQAYISTIHAFGLRVLKEFAFDCGISPGPRLLNDDEETTLMRQALNISTHTETVIDDLARFGYSYSFGNDKSAEEQFRDAILQLIAKLRSIGRFDEDFQLLPYAEQLILDIYGDTAVAATLENSLHQAVMKLLNKFPADMTDIFGGNATAIKALRQNYRDLKRAQNKEVLSTEWKLWQRLRNLRVIGVSEEYSSLAEDVKTAASALPRHPGPLIDALEHVRAVLTTSQKTLIQHTQKKRELELLDYTDMLAMTHTLFCNNQEVRDIFRQRIDCLIIDEFQDTNPLQFSLLWQFHTLGVPTLIVGDLKQAIMGFQNADSRLLQALQTQHPDNCQPLTGNWRSTPQLMQWINKIGSGLFADQYTPLQARADYPSSLDPLELICFNKRPKKTINQIHTTVQRISAMLADEQMMVYDRVLGKQRQVRGGDIAVLCPTNERLDQFSAHLRNFGIRTKIARGGWFESRIVQLMYYALAYVADQSDRHAALYLCVTELGNHSLQEALEQFVHNKVPQDAVLGSLSPLTEQSVEWSVSTTVAAIIETLSLYRVIAQWPEAEQARANLMRLENEAVQFQETDPVALSSVGYYGSGVKTFLAWLKDKVAKDEKNGQPDAKVNDEDAIELSTWHRAKGREWPIVIVASLEKQVKVRLPSVDVVYADFDLLDTILEQAKIEISPDFAATETHNAFAQRLLDETYDEAYRLLYVALTRAREKLLMEWPEYLAKSKAKDKTYWALLKEKTVLNLTDKTMSVGKDNFECTVSYGYDEEITFPIASKSTEQQQNTRIQLEVGGQLPQLTPDSMTPSQLHIQPSASHDKLRLLNYSQQKLPVIDLSPAERGTLLHQCIEFGFNENIHETQLLAALDYPLTTQQWAQIKPLITDLHNYLRNNYQPISITCELPILFVNENNSVVSGIIDLLVETADGFLIIDHKSDIDPDCATKFYTYLPQLLCYAQAMTKSRSDKPVLSVAINWTALGSLSVQDMD